MTVETNNLKIWIQDMAALIEQNAEPDPQHYAPFLQEPNLALRIVELLASLEDNPENEDQSYYSACIFALEICVAQLQSAEENGSKGAAKTLSTLMSKVAQEIRKETHSLGFWLPILNAFYEVHTELSEELKDAYLELASMEEDFSETAETSHLNTMQEMLTEMADLSDFDIAENFFAQSYAMPPDFFTDLIFDLYSIEQGQDIALLTMLHPKQEVREVVVATLEQLMDKITLSPRSLTRLQVIKNWYPVRYEAQLNRWIKMQRKKEVIFGKEKPLKIVQIKASEVDGSGAQGIFIHLKEGSRHRLCGLLFKQDYGIKDAWLTAPLNREEVRKYYIEAFDENVSLREIDESFLLLFTNHFLQLSLDIQGIPHLHLLAVQEALGLNFLPKRIDISYLMESLSVQIVPFTAETVKASLQRSKKWLKTKKFCESWFVENAKVDKLVNRCCSIVEGVKFCALEEAMSAVFAQEFEMQREKWLFHFLWTALWARAKENKSEKIWQDSFIIAYSIYTGEKLTSIPIMNEICRQTVLNSIDTMQDRRTYLNKE